MVTHEDLLPPTDKPLAIYFNICEVKYVSKLQVALLSSSIGSFQGVTPEIYTVSPT